MSSGGPRGMGEEEDVSLWVPGKHTAPDPDEGTPSTNSSPAIVQRSKRQLCNALRGDAPLDTGGSKLGDGLTNNVLVGAVERLDHVDEDDEDGPLLGSCGSNSASEGPASNIGAAP
eukprot:15446109-Alexandrium_andersonii.AAC.1